MTRALIYPRKRRTAMNLILSLSLTLLGSLLAISPANAQQDGDQKAAQGSTIQPPVKKDQAAAKPDSEKDAEGTDKGADESETGSVERFDPSEEISKDLSVSFPVDI